VKSLRHVSDGLTVLAVVLLVLGLTVSTALLVGAAIAFAGAVTTTVVKRNRAKARRS
jgi:heme O synthase-like polyprenyltransferase